MAFNSSMQRAVYGLCFSLIGLSIATAGAQDVTLPNADFERGDTGWLRRFPQAAQEQVVADPERPANKVGQIRSTAKAGPAVEGEPAPPYYFARSIPLEGGQPYRFSLRLRTAIERGEAGFLLIFTRDGKPVERRLSGESVDIPVIATKAPWQEIAFEIVAPRAADGVTLQVNLDGQGSLWLDDLKVTKMASTETARIEKERKTAQLAVEKRNEAAHLKALRAIKRVAVPKTPFLFVNEAEIATARRRAESAAWAKQMKEGYLKTAQPWLGKTLDDIKDLTPPKGAIYVYGLGLNLDPVKGERIKWRGWNDPHHIEGTDGAIYPNEKYPDEGSGWFDAKTGKTYYFVANTYGFIIAQWQINVLPALVNSYLLTGDERYAERALWILDAIAAIYPRAYEGPIDYPGNFPNVPDGGRLERPQYQAARALIRYAFFYDALGTSPLLKSDSWANPGRTVQENIETNMLLDGAEYCLRMAHKYNEINNGVIDYNRGPLVVGALLGIEDWVKWALESKVGFKLALNNTIDADGRYYETSPSYGSHTRELMQSSAQVLKRMRLPAYPNGWNAYDDVRFRRFCLEFFSGLQVMGRIPYYGDAGPDRLVKEQDRWFEKESFESCGQFFAGSTQAATQRQALKLAYWMTDGQTAEVAHGEWDLYHAPDWQDEFEKAKLGPADRAIRPSGPTLFNGAGLAILRHGQGKNERAALLRFGPTLNHGQLDETNLQFFARGREFSFDPGYFNTHLRFGFTSSTVAHNLVVANRHNQLRLPAPGGDLQAFMTGPVLSSLEVDDAAAYRDERLDEYRRRVALIDLSPEDSYLVDTFWVRGAQTYDYSLHGINKGSLKIDSTPNATLIEKREGSVLGPNIDYVKDSDNNGRVKSFPQADFYFAPPGQGYGYLDNPAYYKINGPLDLQWDASDDTRHHLYVTHVAPPGAQLITTGSPRGIEAPYMLSRVDAATNQRVRYSSVIQPASGASKIESVTAIPAEQSDDTALGLRIRLATAKLPQGAIAEHLYFADPDGTTLHRFADGIQVQGREGMLALNAAAEVVAASLTGAGKLVRDGFSMTVEPVATQPLKVMRIERAPLRVQLDTALPEPEKLAGALVRIGAGIYSRPVALRAVAAHNEGGATWLTFAASDEVVSTGFVTAFDAAQQTLETDSPFPRARPHIDSYDRETGVGIPGKLDEYNGLFDGCVVTTGETARARIRQVSGARSRFKLSDGHGTFAVGAKFQICSFAVGDTLEIPAWAQATRQGNDWQITGPAKVRIGR